MADFDRHWMEFHRLQERAGEGEMLNESRVESRMLAILSEHDLDDRPLDALRVSGLGGTVVAATDIVFPPVDEERG